MHQVSATRRDALAGLLIGAAGLVAPAAFGAEPVTVEIESGKLAGVRENDCVSFKGVPYAADTGGSNRFMPPRPAQAWTGVREAFAFGDRCPQAGRLGQDAGAPQPASGPAPKESENCCVLNVFTTDVSAAARRPVMFWIHGSGFRGGSGDIDGSNLAKMGDVVVVTVNHRVNVFGYTNLGLVDPAFADAGNVGQLDLIAALQWVKRNIRAFGGDPDRVTLFGVSGGGSKIATLMVMPGASGLFHRAINMSGTSFYGIASPREWEPLTTEFLKGLGLNKSNLRNIQQMAPAQLFDAYGKAIAALNTDDFRPVVDGRNIVHGPLTAEGLAMNPSVPLIVGNTETEALSYLLRDQRNAGVTEDQLKAKIKAQFSLDDAKVSAILAGYRQGENSGRTAWDVLLEFSSDVLFRGRMLNYAEALARTRRTPVYLYSFVSRQTRAGKAGTPHGSDIPFAFGNVATAMGPAAQEASRNMVAFFSAFARSGDPNNSRTPQWRPFDAATNATMIISEQCRQVNDFRAAERQASRAHLEQDSFELLAGPLFRYAA